MRRATLHLGIVLLFACTASAAIPPCCNIWSIDRQRSKVVLSRDGVLLQFSAPRSFIDSLKESDWFYIAGGREHGDSARIHLMREGSQADSGDIPKGPSDLTVVLEDVRFPESCCRISVVEEFTPVLVLRDLHTAEEWWVATDSRAPEAFKAGTAAAIDRNKMLAFVRFTGDSGKQSTVVCKIVPSVVTADAIGSRKYKVVGDVTAQACEHLREPPATEQARKQLSLNARDKNADAVIAGDCNITQERWCASKVAVCHGKAIRWLAAK